MSALNDFTASLPNLAPKRPPRTLSVHDRKVNVDGLPPEPSMYLLAREWVANNPHKPTYVRPMLLAAVGGVQLPAPLPHTPHSLAKLSSGSKRKVSELSISSSRASAELILEQHVEHARDVRRWVKVQRQANLERFRCVLPRPFGPAHTPSRVLFALLPVCLDSPYPNCPIWPACALKATSAQASLRWAGLAAGQHADAGTAQHARGAKPLRPAARVVAAGPVAAAAATPAAAVRCRRCRG